MNALNNKHLDFVPNKMVKHPAKDNNTIFVFSSRNNGKIYKKKRVEVGLIYKHPKAKVWVFHPISDRAYEFDTLFIISFFLKNLKTKVIRYDKDKGELICKQY